MIQRTTATGDVTAGGGILIDEPFRLESLALLPWGTSAAGGLRIVTGSGSWLMVNADVLGKIHANLRQ